MQVQKNKVKRIFIIIILIFIFLVFGIMYFSNKYTPVEYFYDNHNKLISISNYIEKNNLDGYLYFKDQIISSSGSIGECLYSGCDKYEDAFLYAQKLEELSDGVGYGNEEFLIFSLPNHVYMGKDVYDSGDASFVYKKGYFKDKKTGYSNKGNGDKSGIIYIFDDDWGVVSWCYKCFGGAWD